MAGFVGLSYSPASSVKDSTSAVLVDGAETQSEYITGSAGVNVQSTIVATDSMQIARVVVKITDMWIAIGPDPVADQGTGFLVLAGTTEYFALNVGDKVGVFETI